MKIGIFGGCFNPVHTGHILVARDVKEELGLDRVVLVVSHHPPHRDPEVSFENRYQMCSMAVEYEPAFAVSDLERKMDMDVSYTVVVLEEIRRELPDDQLYLFIGSDQYEKLPTWHQPERLFDLTSVVVLRRAGHTADPNAPFGDRVIFARNRLIQIESFDIRQRARLRKPIDYMVPRRVRNYILGRELYL